MNGCTNLHINSQLRQLSSETEIIRQVAQGFVGSRKPKFGMEMRLEQIHVFSVHVFSMKTCLYEEK